MIGTLNTSDIKAGVEKPVGCSSLIVRKELNLSAPGLL